MAIEFRCTGCRAKLHVPSRWESTSVPCPKCGTRVVVPEAGQRRPATRFETREVEASIAALGPRAGGLFSDPAFELPGDVGDQETPTAAGVGAPLVTISRRGAYALLGASLAAAVALFLTGACLGAWWARQHS